MNMYQQETQSNKMQLKNIDMEIPYVYNKLNNLHGNSSRFLVIIRHSESKFLLKILVQALILALLIMVLAGVFRGSYSKQNIIPINTNNIKLSNNNNNNENEISLVFEDLSNEGLWKRKDESLIVSNTNKDFIQRRHKVTETQTISPSNKKQMPAINNETFTLAFTDNFESAIEEGFLDRILKIGGVMVVQLSQDPSMAFEVLPNYKIVYFRKFSNSTFIAMRKIDNANSMESRSATQRKILQFLSEEKKAILGNLEDVLLEPPRSATGKSKTYLRKTKFLPDLLNDSLEGYSRRVYIDVGGGHGSTRWFEQNYPTRNKDFDMYRIETVPETEVESADDAWEGPPTQMGISDWLWRNVKAEEYVVMKADAEVVEEMLKSKAIALVDELFMECKPLGKGGNSKRAYWECLALYGRLRDFGVAVHQWWG